MIILKFPFPRITPLYPIEGKRKNYVLTFAYSKYNSQETQDAKVLLSIIVLITSLLASKLESSQKRSGEFAYFKTLIVSTTTR